MPDRLLLETKQAYQDVRQEYARSGYDNQYRLNAFWGMSNMREMLDILGSSHTAQEALDAIHRTLLFSVNSDEPVKEKAVDWLLRNQLAAGLDLFATPAELRESTFAHPGNNVARHGRILTPDFLRTVSIAHELDRRCEFGQGKLRILELGAGCGRLARTLKLLRPGNTHVIVDIPETLCFSHMFLRSNFPDARTLFVRTLDALAGVRLDDYDFVFAPTMFAEGLLGNSFDLFLNTASLGEMRNEVIRHWIDFVQRRLDVRYLYTLNRFLNTIPLDGRHDWRLEENECSLRYDAGWDLLQWELEPRFTRCPYVDTVICRYVEIVARRRPIPAPDHRRAHAQAMERDVRDEDWVRLRETFPAAMTYRDNILVHDLGMQGALFKLWDAIRHEATASNVGLMLQYLETLLHRDDREFEETFFYEDLFCELAAGQESEETTSIAETLERKRSRRREWLPPAPRYDYVPSARRENPLLIEEDYWGFNIVRYRDEFFALAQAAGPVHLERMPPERLAELMRQGACFVESTIDGVKRRVAESQLQQTNMRHASSCRAEPAAPAA